jgi:hypothetical protein
MLLSSLSGFVLSRPAASNSTRFDEIHGILISPRRKTQFSRRRDMYYTNNLVSLIERNAESLAKRWLEIVRTHPGTPTFHNWNEDQLFTRVYKVYSYLGRSISDQTTREDIEREYVALGRQRFAEGFALSEVIQALIISRRVLWLKIQADGLLDTAMDLHLGLDLNNKVVLFFDRAIYYTTMGFEEAARAVNAPTHLARTA